MEKIYAQISEETIKFGPDDDVKWRDRYSPLYPDPPEGIHVVRDEAYGPAERNTLDVYIPKGNETGMPVLLFIHGGGFFSGDKMWNEKCYGNIGYHFSQRGIVTVIANHRLVPHARYPDGADDIQMMRDWIHQNIPNDAYGNGSPEKVFIFGHSSGGAHVCMNLFAAGDPERPAADPLWPPIAGVILWDVPFWFDNKKPVRQKTLRSYWGSDHEDTWGPKSALGLFQRLPENSPVLDSRKLPIYLGSVEYEIPETTDATLMFLNSYRGRSRPFATLPAFHILKGHNHLSNILSVGTEDTAQADKISEFVQHCLDVKRSCRL